MSQKKLDTTRLQHTLDELDSALEQWDSITNIPQSEQEPSEAPAQQRAKILLKELRNQLLQFENDEEISEEL